MNDAAAIATLPDGRLEPFRQLLEQTLQALLDGQMGELLGEPALGLGRARTGRRAGHAARRLATRVGTVRLQVPRGRAGWICAELLDRYADAEDALLSALAEMAVRRLSTAEVCALAEEQHGQAFSVLTLGRAGQAIDDALARFALAVPEIGGPRPDGMLGEESAPPSVCAEPAVATAGLPSRRRASSAAGSVLAWPDLVRAANRRADALATAPGAEERSFVEPKADGSSLAALQGSRSGSARQAAVLAGGAVAAGLAIWGAVAWIGTPIQPGVSLTHNGNVAHPAAAVPPPRAQAVAVAARSAAAVPPHARLELAGVVAGAAPETGGIALIRIDGQPAQVFRVGAPVDGELVLLAVDADRAALGTARGPATLVLATAPGVAGEQPTRRADAGRAFGPGAWPPEASDSDVAGSVQPAVGRMLSVAAAAGDERAQAIVARAHLPQPVADAVVAGAESAPPTQWPSWQIRLRQRAAGR